MALESILEHQKTRSVPSSVASRGPEIPAFRMVSTRHDRHDRRQWLPRIQTTQAEQSREMVLRLQVNGASGADLEQFYRKPKAHRAQRIFDFDLFCVNRQQRQLMAVAARS